MIPLAPGLWYSRRQISQRAGIIATAVLHGPGGVALIDPGPSSTLPALRAALQQAGIGLSDLRAILLTHIHLDHAGATGTLVRERPDLRVYVHDKGAPHMADPEKLVASATRLWGDEMERLWGEVLPVPKDAITVLSGGEHIEASGPRPDSHLHAGPRVASRELLQRRQRRRVRRRHRRHPAGGRRLRAAANASAGHQYRAMAREPGADRWLARGNPVHHALRPTCAVRSAPHRNGGSPDARGQPRARVARAAGRRRRAGSVVSRRGAAGAAAPAGGRDADAYKVAGRFDLNWKGFQRYWKIGRKRLLIGVARGLSPRATQK